jgi:large subunit ribosomal protein L21
LNPVPDPAILFKFGDAAAFAGLAGLAGGKIAHPAQAQVPYPRPGTTVLNLSADYASPSLRQFEGSTMYAVIRTGGKQYLVSPGETLKIERTEHKDGAIEFSDVLAVSAEAGKFEDSLKGAKVTGTVINEGKGDKILVFKMKRKKQYKKRFGHRQNFAQVRINEIVVNGKSFKAE